MKKLYFNVASEIEDKYQSGEYALDFISDALQYLTI